MTAETDILTCSFARILVPTFARQSSALPQMTSRSRRHLGCSDNRGVTWLLKPL